MAVTFPAGPHLTECMMNAGAASTLPPEARRIACMEVWGGNDGFVGGVSVPGHDVFVSCDPHTGGSHGGDVYYISNCAAGLITRFILADISGHGAEAAPVARRLRDLMRRHINTADQSRFARALNSEFATLAVDGRFATALLLTYFAPTDHLILCNAGHPRPLHYDAQRGAWGLLDAEAPGAVVAARDPTAIGIENLPLGILAPTAYQQFSIRLSPGDVVVVYSDALMEAAPPGGRPIGELGLLRLAARLDPRDPARLGSELLGAVLGVAARARLDDDATLIVMHHNASDPPRVTLGARARTLAHMLGIG